MEDNFNKKVEKSIYDKEQLDILKNEAESFGYKESLILIKEALAEINKGFSNITEDIEKAEVKLEREGFSSKELNDEISPYVEEASGVIISAKNEIKEIYDQFGYLSDNPIESNSIGEVQQLINEEILRVDSENITKRENIIELEDHEVDFLRNYKTPLSVEEDSDFFQYKLMGYEIINQLLREGEDVNFNNLKKKNPDYQDALIEIRLDLFNHINEQVGRSYVTAENSDIKLYRNIHNNSESINDPMYNLKEGDIFLEKGFMSTAFNNKIIEANKKTKNKYDQNFVTTSVEIIIPKGDSVNGTYLGGIESEFLLPPDTELEIIKRDVNESGQVTLSAIIKPNI